jgi:hypothetical protein
MQIRFLKIISPKVYNRKKAIPENLKSNLPSIEELEAEFSEEKKANDECS